MTPGSCIAGGVYAHMTSCSTDNSIMFSNCNISDNIGNRGGPCLDCGCACALRQGGGGDGALSHFLFTSGCPRFSSGLVMVTSTGGAFVLAEPSIAGFVRFRFSLVSSNIVGNTSPLAGAVQVQVVWHLGLYLHVQRSSKQAPFKLTVAGTGRSRGGIESLHRRILCSGALSCQPSQCLRCDRGQHGGKQHRI